MRKFATLILVLCLLTAMRCEAHLSVGYEATAAVAREGVWRAITSGEGDTATVAVMDGGKIVYSECFGAAERATNRLSDSRTRFNIGSTSKMFAAVAILLLADDGKLTLDDPVVKHLPEFTMRDGRYRDITVRMLFNHSSGLPGTTFTFEYEPSFDTHALLLEVLRESDLKHSPGAMGIYCNDGFTLAEMIVERLSGKSFIDFVAERIFTPLAMQDSAASIGEIGGEVAFFYDVPKGRKFPLEAVRVHAAGGLSSTAEDLCRFADSFTAGGDHILSDAMLEEALKSHPTPFTKHLRGRAILDAFGWDYAWIPSYRDDGIQVLGKSGGTIFFSTNLLVAPSERLAVAVSIAGGVDAPGICRTIFDALMKEKGLPHYTKPPLEKPKAPQPIPQELLAFEGDYVKGDCAVRFVFDRDEGILNIHCLLPAPKQGEEAPPPMSYVYSEGMFHDLDAGTSYYFVSDGDEKYLFADRISGYGMNTLAYQKLKGVESPKRLALEMDGVLWITRNALPSELIVDGRLTLRSSISSELPGYVFTLNPQRVENADSASIAATSFRDQFSLTFFQRGGKTRMRAAHMIFSRADEAEALAAGVSGVVTPQDGENEWRRAEEDMILSFSIPHKGRVVAVNPDGAVSGIIYDSAVDSGELYAPGGSLIMFAGAPGDEFTVKTR